MTLANRGGFTNVIAGLVAIPHLSRYARGAIWRAISRGIGTMTATRFLPILVITFAVVQVAAAEDKKTTTSKSSSGKAIEVQDYGFGVSVPVTTSKKKGGSNSAPSPTRSAGKSGSRH